MKILFPIIVSLVLLDNKLKAQHCYFDLASIIVIYLHSDTSVIPNLKITLLDSLGNAVFTKEDTVIKFRRNTKEYYTAGKTKAEDPNPWLEPKAYWFAKDNYFIVASKLLLNQTKKIKIEDIDGEESFGYFEAKIIDFTENYLYPLCTGRSGWAKGEKYGFVEGYKPLDVILKKSGK